VNSEGAQHFPGRIKNGCGDANRTPHSFIPADCISLFSDTRDILKVCPRIELSVQWFRISRRLRNDSIDEIGIFSKRHQNLACGTSVKRIRTAHTEDILQFMCALSDHDGDSPDTYPDLDRRCLIELVPEGPDDLSPDGRQVVLRQKPGRENKEARPEMIEVARLVLDQQAI
jgi:hypothetical protein